MNADAPAGPDGAQFECGFFLPPISFWLLAPWAMSAWPVARWVWVAVSVLAAISPARLTVDERSASDQIKTWGWAAAAILLNPLVWRAVSLGQTTFFVVGCVVAACWAHERKQEWLSILLWSLSSLKPQIGIPLCLFAAYRQGLRSASGIFVAAIVGNACGAAMLGNPLAVLGDYVRYLGASHDAVGFNRASYDQITSWNRLVVMFGGPEISLGAPAVVLGAISIAALIYVLRYRTGPRPTDAWLLATTVTWAPVVAQLHGYDLVAWALMIPYLRELYATRRWGDLTFLLIVIGAASMPLAVVGALAEGSPHASAIRSYRTVIVLIVAVYFLARRSVVNAPVA